MASDFDLLGIRVRLPTARRVRQPWALVRAFQRMHEIAPTGKRVYTGRMLPRDEGSIANYNMQKQKMLVRVSA